MSLDSDLVRELRQRARSEGATPFMVCLAAFAVLIGRYARTDHFLIGVPSAGRNAPGSDALIGLFINSMVMRLDLRGDPSFSELVARVRAATLGVMSHQDLPFDVLVEHLAADRMAGRTPMFQVMLDYINTPGSELSLGSLDLEPVSIADEASVYDVNLYLFDDGTGIDAKWEYRSDLFDRATIVRMSEAYASVLRAAVTDPKQATTALPLVSPQDRARIRSLGTGPSKGAPGRASFLAAIQDHARRHPETEAIVADGIALSYQQLWRLADDVAGQIASTCPDDALIAIQTGRSIDFVPALLGVLRSGRTAVMLDPSQPARRLSAMLEQVELDATIASGAGGAPHVEVHRPRRGATTHPPTADDPAYVVFTSGSTGVPRPVVLGRAGLENFVADARERYALTSDDRVLQFASTGFDTILEEILPTLASGATLVMRPVELFSSFADFTKFVGDRGVTVLDLPTAWWHAWTDDMRRTETTDVPESVRLVIIGGEAARMDRWRAWQDITGGRIRLVNTYGPSETTVVVATFEPPHDWSPAMDVVPIGLPIANTRLLVVDEGGHVVPPGVPGELVIEGAPVGHGYLHHTGEIPAFDVGEGGVRRYRTGDLARVSVDGVHEFLGRIDDQLKISGVRIEPGEIEAALRSHAAVDDAVVIRVDSEGGDRLVAHVVSSRSPDVASIRSHLRDRLPEPMIPGSIVVRSSLPLTTSGKIDRMALRDQADDRPPQVEHQEPDRPPTPTELRLIGVWETVMARTALRVDDDFFAVGGHSLLGVRLISHATDEFGVELPLRVLYEAPTVAGMARWIDGLLRDTDPGLETRHEEMSNHVGA